MVLAGAIGMLPAAGDTFASPVFSNPKPNLDTTYIFDLYSIEDPYAPDQFILSYDEWLTLTDREVDIDDVYALTKISLLFDMDKEALDLLTPMEKKAYKMFWDFYELDETTVRGDDLFAQIERKTIRQDQLILRGTYKRDFNFGKLCEGEKVGIFFDYAYRRRKKTEDDQIRSLERIFSK